MPSAVRRSPPQLDALEAFGALLADVDEAGEREAFYSRLAEAVCGLSGMTRAVVFRYEPVRRRVEAAGSHNIDLEPFTAERMTIESSDIARAALLEDRVLEDHPPFEGHVPERLLAIANEGPLVCVPMSAAGRRIGLVVGQREPGSPPLSDGLRDWLRTLGKVAALATTTRIATFERERARTLEERIDLAREIHDGVVQRLCGVSLALAASEHHLPSAERARCGEEIQRALADLRAALRRPLGRESRPVGSTLGEEIERLRQVSPGLAVRVLGDPAAVPEPLQPLAQSVFGEAIANAQRHARPQTIEIDVAHRDGAFILEVANDGVGGARRPGTAMGIGLRLAAFEALRESGLVEFGPGADGWWKVRLVVPDPPAPS